MYWLSGSVCAGKTTNASNIAEKMGWNIYHCDAWLDQHRNEASPEKHPVFYKTSRLRGDDLWLRPLEEQIATDSAAADEEIELAINDIKKLLTHDNKALIFDGYVLPKKLLTIQPTKQRIFYLIAAEDFQLEQYKQRPWTREVLASTSNKELAWQNWMQRDLASNRNLKKQVIENNMPWLLIDGTVPVKEVTRQILKHFTKE